MNLVDKEQIRFAMALAKKLLPIENINFTTGNRKFEFNFKGFSKIHTLRLRELDTLEPIEIVRAIMQAKPVGVDIRVSLEFKTNPQRRSMVQVNQKPKACISYELAQYLWDKASKGENGLVQLHKKTMNHADPREYNPPQPTAMQAKYDNRYDWQGNIVFKFDKTSPIELDNKVIDETNFSDFKFIK